jgi:aspartyl-tRNA(Asn)/glutamyl-tRNA(Gln) amidotransferase subunit B
MKTYTATIGLEIHAELKTRTKMFCDSKNDPDEKRPNVNVCPVCMGYPGTLPTLNEEAIRHVIRVGIAVGGNIADFTEWDRKNYFYPDIPKGYQISQYAHPLVKGGMLAGVALTRIHLEEDTARSSHEGGRSLVDFNRAGIPLMELVTEPVIRTGEEASRFAKELQLTLQYLGAGEANMEKGEMRVEANISVSATETFGTKVEIKNLNSFRSVEKAIDFEIRRQSELLEKGESVVQETRGWDEAREVTFSQRIKEDSHDYRYFPDPDIPKLWTSEVPTLRPETLKAGLPELPWERRTRYLALGIKAEDAEMYVRSLAWGEYFDAVRKLIGAADDPAITPLLVTASNFISSDLAGLIKSAGDESSEGASMAEKVSPQHFVTLIKMYKEGVISSRVAKDLLKLVYEGEGDPAALAEKKGLIQKSDEGELQAIVDQVWADNAAVAAEYVSGKDAAVQFLVGQGMKLSKGAANPGTLKALFEKKRSQA